LDRRNQLRGPLADGLKGSLTPAEPATTLNVDGCAEVRDSGDSRRFCGNANFFPIAWLLLSPPDASAFSAVRPDPVATRRSGV